MKYDTVIAGAGISGLMCGYILAKEGQKVCILEKNPIPGGCTQNFTFRRKVFDPGAHYIGGIEAGQSLHAFFKYFGLLNKLPFYKLDEKAFDKLHFTDKTYAFAQSKEGFINGLSNDFPKEKNNIRKFTDYLEKSAHSFPGFSLTHKNKVFKDDIFKKNAFEEIQKYISDTKLQNILFGNSPAYDGHPETTPFYIYALLTYGYIESAYRIIGGSGKIAEQLAENFENTGGCIRYNFNVQKILTDAHGKPTGIQSKTNESIYGNTIISTLHPSKFIAISPDGLFRNAFKYRINKLADTTGVFSVYATLKENSFPFINSVNYCTDRLTGKAIEAYNNNEFGEQILLLTQPSQEKQRYADSLQLMTAAAYSLFKKWEKTTVGKRGKDYRSYKREIANTLIKKTEKFFPGITESIVHINTSSPLTYRDYTGSRKGSIYGTEKDSNNYILTNISHKTKIPNLYLGGQSANIHGVHGAAAGAYMLCSDILGADYLRKKITEEC
jgi:all-trans-retinol 13,14-reductase